MLLQKRTNKRSRNTVGVMEKIAITVIMSNGGKTVNGERRFVCRAPQ